MHHLVSEDLKPFRPLKAELPEQRCSLCSRNKASRWNRGSFITSVAQLLTAPSVCISYSRRTGYYTVQQNTHGDGHGPPTTADGTKPNQPLPIPRSQPSCSPKNSPNIRSRPPPSCQRCNSQVGGLFFIYFFLIGTVRVIILLYY